MTIAEVWTLAEHQHGRLTPVSFELLSWGKRLAPTGDRRLCSVLLADEIDDSEVNRLIEHGADRVYFLKHPSYKNFLVEPYADGIVEMVQRYQPEVFLAAATTTGRTVMPYVSVLVHGGLTADCTGLEMDAETGLLLQTRPAIGGNILATIKTPTCRPQMATVRPKSIQILPGDPTRKGEIVLVDLEGITLREVTQFERFIPDREGSPGIESADVVVAGGKGLKSKQNFTIIEDLAGYFHAAVGTSRPPVDQGWEPYSAQVGLSGKTITPKLYFACGISGSIQHLAGIQTAKTIVAVNSDPHAQIFQVADFGVVGDLFEFLPIFLRKAKLYRENETK